MYCIGVVFAGLCIGGAVAGAAPGLAVGVPTGPDLPGMQFDARIEMAASGPASPLVLWCRYWVTSKAYRAEVLWMEPHWLSRPFPCYPVGLVIRSEERAFVVSQSFLGDSWSYRRPFAGRDGEPISLGSYGIQDIRFADKEAGQVRVRRADLACDKSIALGSGAGIARVRCQGGLLVGLDFLTGRNGKIFKSVRYSYRGRERRLERQEVVFPEDSVLVSGLSGALTVNGKRHEIAATDKWPVTWNPGGTRCVVAWKEVVVGDEKHNLPHVISVRSGRSDVVRRRAVLSDFNVIGGLGAAARGGAPSAGFSEAELQYRKIEMAFERRLFSRDSARTLTDEEERELRLSRSVIAETLERSRDTAVKIRASQELCRIGLLDGEVERTRTAFRRYLALLKRSGLGNDLLLYVGRDAVRAAVVYGRPAIAREFLEAWAAQVEPQLLTEGMLTFVERSVARGHLAAAQKVLGTMGHAGDAAPSVRSAMAYLTAMTSHKLAVGVASSDGSTADRLDRALAVGDRTKQQVLQDAARDIRRSRRIIARLAKGKHGEARVRQLRSWEHEIEKELSGARQVQE